VPEVESLLVFFTLIRTYHADITNDRNDYSIFLPPTCMQKCAVTVGTEAFATKIHKCYKLHSAQTARLAET